MDNAPFIIDDNFEIDYPPGWAKVELMISPEGQMHICGGDRDVAGNIIGIDRMRGIYGMEVPDEQEGGEGRSSPDREGLVESEAEGDTDREGGEDMQGDRGGEGSTEGEESKDLEELGEG